MESNKFSESSSNDTNLIAKKQTFRGSGFQSLDQIWKQVVTWCQGHPPENQFVGVKVEDAENRVKWKRDKGERKRRRSHRHIQTHSRNKEMSTRITTVCAPTLNQIAIVYKMDVNSELSTAPLWIYVLTSIPNGTAVR